MLVAVVENPSAVLVVVAVTAEPPLELKETVRFFATHLAYRVKFEVWPWVYGKVILDPV